MCGGEFAGGCWSSVLVLDPPWCRHRSDWWPNYQGPVYCAAVIYKRRRERRRLPACLESREKSVRECYCSSITEIIKNPHLTAVDCVDSPVLKAMMFLPLSHPLSMSELGGSLTFKQELYSSNTDSKQTKPVLPSRDPWRLWLCLYALFSRACQQNITNRPSHWERTGASGLSSAMTRPQRSSNYKGPLWGRRVSFSSRTSDQNTKAVAVRRFRLPSAGHHQ